MSALIISTLQWKSSCRPSLLANEERQTRASCRETANYLMYNSFFHSFIYISKKIGVLVNADGVG